MEIKIEHEIIKELKEQNFMQSQTIHCLELIIDILKAEINEKKRGKRPIN